MAYDFKVFTGTKTERDALAVIADLRTQGLIPGFMSDEYAINVVGKHYTFANVTWDLVIQYLPIYFREVYPGIAAGEMLGVYAPPGGEFDADIDATQKTFFTGLWDGFAGHLQSFAVGLWKWITLDVLGMTAENFDSFLNSMVSKGIIDDESKAGIGEMINTFPKGHAWMYAATFLGIFKTFISVFISAVGGTLMKRLNKTHTPNVPDPNSVIRAAFLDPALQDRVREVMAENGLDKADQDLMFAANYFTFDPGTITELRLRGFIDDTRMNKYFDDLGVTPARRADAIKLMQRLPPLQDIATMMAKEAFEPGQVALMGLAKELPGEFVKYAGEHGLSKEWAEKYWIAHWQQPGIQMMFEAFHRRLIDRQFLQEFMRIVEIPPYLRDILTDLAYMVLTRVDIRRMYSDGILNVEQTYSAYLDHGYSPENATLMTNWTIRYAEPNEKELSRTQITNLYIDGQINRADAVIMLVKIGYPEHRAELLIVYAEYEEIKDLQNEQMSNVELLFKENWIDEPAARGELGKLDLSGERISILLQKWKVKKAVSTKRPSKTDLDKFLRNEIIDPTNYYSEMQGLGYSQKYIDMYYALVTKEGE